MTITQGKVRSADGTTIAYEQSGVGPALIMVEAAGHFRALSSFDSLVDLLTPHFTVVRYDRRGRGDSGDTAPYSIQREVDDLAALVSETGGSASVYGFSSGALLALHAAARQLHIPKLVLLEPPLGEEDTTESEFTAQLRSYIASRQFAGAVDYFHTSIGVPAEMIDEMRGSHAWRAIEAIADTLVYDAMLNDKTPPSLLTFVTTPTLVIDSEGSSDNLTGWAASVAGGLANGSHQSLPGEWHGVADDVLAPVVIDFLERG